MTVQSIAVILGICLLAAVVWIFVLRKERDKYLLQYKPTKDERDQLKNDVEKLNKKLALQDASKADSKQAEDSSKPAQGGEKKQDKSEEKKAKVVSEESAKLKEVKEENYRLKQDNKELRKSLKEKDSADSDTQKDLIEAREESSQLQRELDNANTRIKLLEREAQDRKSDVLLPTIDVGADPVNEQEEKLRREVDHMNEKWRQTRDELDSLKKNYRSDLDEAKKEFSEANKSVRRELGQAKRQLAQAKKRADNNHRIFLIARSQLLLVEETIKSIDPSYKSALPLATSDSGIEDRLNKFVTQSARHDKAVEEAERLSLRVSELEGLLESKGIHSESAPAEAVDTAALDAIRLDSKEMDALDSGWDFEGL